jgi:hypothetical protein
MFALRDVSTKGLELFINFALAQADGSKLVIGVSSLMHLQQIHRVLIVNSEILGGDWAPDTYQKNSTRYKWEAVV